MCTLCHLSVDGRHYALYSDRFCAEKVHEQFQEPPNDQLSAIQMLSCWYAIHPIVTVCDVSVTSHIDGVAKLHKLEHFLVITTCMILAVCSFMMTFSIFAAFQEAYTWIHLLLVPQLLGLLWALAKLRTLSS